MAEIVIDGIRKAFGPVVALEKVQLTVPDGEFLALLGPSGCGKTTLLRIIAGLETQTEGRVLIGGRDVSQLPPRKRGLAMVFQNYAVFPHLTVAENVAFGLRMAGADKARIDRQVNKVAGLLHIEPYLARYPGQLSGGQRQRVAVARALAARPGLVLADEPTAALDRQSGQDVVRLLTDLARQRGVPILLVTHDPRILDIADRIVAMEDGKVI